MNPGAESVEDSSSAPNRLRAFRLAAGILIAAFLCHLAYGYELDELMHLHSAWCIGQGALPYRDFYENHPPLFHFLAAPFTRSLTDATTGVLVAARLFGLAIAAAILALFYRLLGIVIGRKAWWGVFALLLTFPFITVGLELRPDWLALAGVLGALLLVVTAESLSPVRSLAKQLFAGALIGAGLCLTQKTILVAAGMTIWMIGTIACAAPPVRGRRIGGLAAFVIGILLCPAVLINVFARQHAAGLLWNGTVLVNLRWGQESPFLTGAREALLVLFPLFVLAFAQLFRLARNYQAELSQATPDSLMAILLACGVAGFLKTPVPNSQWFLFLVAPWMVYLGVRGLVRYVDDPAALHEDRRLLAGGALLSLAALLAMGWVDAVAALVVWGLIGRHAWKRLRESESVEQRGRIMLAHVFTIAALLLTYHLVAQATSRNLQAQERYVALIARENPSGAPLLDIWPVMAPFRPHATYHWFVTGGIYPALAVDKLQDEYLASLMGGSVRLVVTRPQDIDRFLPRLSVYLHAHGTLLTHEKLNTREVDVWSLPDRAIGE
jgi:hypothetical protein